LLDQLRDEALTLEKIMREECGIKTRLDIYPGLPHGFWVGFPEASISRKMRQDSVNVLKWLLEQAK
jgi:acetyl esterase/lipase